MNQYEEELRFALDDCDTEDGISRLFLALAGMMRDRRRPERLAVALERLAQDGLATQEGRELKHLHEAVTEFVAQIDEELEPGADEARPWNDTDGDAAKLIALTKHLTADNLVVLVSSTDRIQAGEKRVKGVMQPVYLKVSMEARVAAGIRARLESDLDLVELALLLGGDQVQRVPDADVPL